MGAAESLGSVRRGLRRIAGALALGGALCCQLPTSSSTSAPAVSTPVNTPVADVGEPVDRRRCPVDFVRTTPIPQARERVIARKKKAWERSLGGEAAAKPHIQARLTGWPRHVLVDRATLPTSDHEWLLRLARDTWRGLDALTDRENGLPLNTVRFARGSVALADSWIGDYASCSDIGLHLIAIVAARELGLISDQEANARIRRVLDTLARLETFRGFYFNYYDTTSLERTSNFVSFVDSSWLTAGLIVVRSAFPEFRERCSALIDRADYDFFYDRASHRLSHGYYTDPGTRSPYDYGMLYTEARLGSLIAIGKGDVPQEQWWDMVRTFPAECGGQTSMPVAARSKRVDAHEVAGGYYEWQGMRFVPSWGGSMFEALMPTLLLDEPRYAPKSLGANDRTHAIVQRRYALQELGYGAWGISPCAKPQGGYGEYGVRALGAQGYEAGVVTPHASALALSVTPEPAIANLRILAQRYDIYGEYGFYDAVDPRDGRVAYSYLALDQAMLFIAVANALNDHCIQKRFEADPVVQRVLPMLAYEDFFD